MKNTCTFEGCYFAGLLDSPKQCPNYMENWYYPQDKDPYMVKDCAPRRTVEMLKDIHQRMIGVQKSNEQERNELNTMVRLIANSSKKVSPVVKQIKGE